MSKNIKILTPVGRLVQGSLYKGSTTDIDGRPLTFKTGENAGQPRVNYWFSLAIAKGNEQHWSQTEWGKIIFEFGHASHPNGAANRPDFAWKIVDGDSQTPNREGRKPCENEGFPGHWVLKLSTSFAIPLYNKDGTMQLKEANAVQPGDYIQIYLTISENDSAANPGIILNPNMVALNAIGEKIILGIDAAEVGFGAAPLPQGAKLADNTTPFAPGPINTMPPGTLGLTTLPMMNHSVPAPSSPIAPYPQILIPPVAPVRQLTEKAGGASYEQLIAAGWNDTLLVQQGLMIG